MLTVMMLMRMRMLVPVVVMVAVAALAPAMKMSMKCGFSHVKKLVLMFLALFFCFRNECQLFEERDVFQSGSLCENVHSAREAF